MSAANSKHRLDRFAGEALALCRELECWCAEIQQATQDSNQGFPAFERKAGLQSLFFFIALSLTTYSSQYVQSAGSTIASLGYLFAMVISLPAAPILFLFQAVGLAKLQFWRALVLHRKQRPKNNYPFTSLISCLERDALEGRRLGGFRTTVLKTVMERIAQEEMELRERLSVLVGSPTVLVLFGVGGGIFTSWESYYTQPDSMRHAALFWGSLVILIVGAYGLHLRLALFEFSRCRGLLSFEIARRAENGAPRPRRHRASAPAHQQ